VTTSPDRLREALRTSDFEALFIDELGWDRATGKRIIEVDEQAFELEPIAQKRGMVAFVCGPAADGRLPPHALRRKIERRIEKDAHEHLIVFLDGERATQVWQWVRREPGNPIACREHTHAVAQPGDALVQKLQAIAFSLEEEEDLTIVDVTGRVRASFDVEKVTKKFYDRFQKEHSAFLDFIEGIDQEADREWYASVMLNRLMFCYFIQKKGFLDGDMDYLRTRLGMVQAERGEDQFHTFYRQFLLRLFHEGLGGSDRSEELEKLLGRIPYLNGGLFDIHELERPDRYGDAIEIPDEAFERIFDYFDQYQWHLDDRPLRKQNEINPDVLGYIFEKYINQKQMGAYYTKEDITEYISKNTVLPYLFDAARTRCKIAFENPGNPTIWDLLRDDPDRYIYEAVRHGTDQPLPEEIAVGVNPPTLHAPVGEGPVATLEARKEWNKPAPPEYALPTEIWREVVARRQKYEENHAKLSAGEILDINELITLNLNIRQFAQDVVETCEGPDLLRAFWKSIESVTILDPTCGSGAFLFAALNILEPLYEACLDRMEAFVEDLERSGEKHRPEKFSDFRRILERVNAHPNRKYFVYKSIILNNLFGVDIMDEAVEICKLRLFLKLAAQVDPDREHKNLGIEPLPDVDFNIRAGNTLVGYATMNEVRKALSSKLDLDNTVEKVEIAAADLQQAFDAFRARQIEGDGSVPPEHKQELNARMRALGEILSKHLAGEYGVDVTGPEEVQSWVRSHSPFHWCVEFHRIVQEGGFNVLIGNPPYLEYSKVKEYEVQEYQSLSCANLYAFTLERSLCLAEKTGRLGLIVPISLACSKRMQPLRELVTCDNRNLWMSHFSNRPGQLFTGAQNRLTIVVAGPTCMPQRRLYSTRYVRWDARNGERDALFSKLKYEMAPDHPSLGRMRLPKLGSRLAVDALTHPMSQKDLGLFRVRDKTNSVYWVRVPGYFCQFFTKPPMAVPEAGGESRVRGEVLRIAFAEESHAGLAHAILNSSLFYLYFCTYTDTRHINPSDVAGFPLDVNAMSDVAEEILRSSCNLAECSRENTSQYRKSGLLIDSIDSRACKPLLDRIDAILGRHFGWSEEQLDYVVNYDIKYRMGRNSDGGNA